MVVRLLEPRAPNTIDWRRVWWTVRARPESAAKVEWWRADFSGCQPASSSLERERCWLSARPALLESGAQSAWMGALSSPAPARTRLGSGGGGRRRRHEFPAILVTLSPPVRRAWSLQDQAKRVMCRLRRAVLNISFQGDSNHLALYSIAVSASPQSVSQQYCSVFQNLSSLTWALYNLLLLLSFSYNVAFVVHNGLSGQSTHIIY